MKTKITSIVLAFVFVASISPNTVAMEREIPCGDNSGIQLLYFPQDVWILILTFVGVSGRIAMLTVSQPFASLMQRLWNDPGFTNWGLWTDRPILHSLILGHAMNVPVVHGDNIYLVCHGEGCCANGFSVMQLDSNAVPVSVPSSITLRTSSFLKPIVADSLIYITEVRHESGSLRVIRQGNSGLGVVQTIPFDFTPGSSLSRGEYLYVLNLKDDYLNIYRRKENQYEREERIYFDFRWMREMVLLSDGDILLVGQFGGLAVVRQDVDGNHKIVQNMELMTTDFNFPASHLHYSPLVDSEFIYVSFDNGEKIQPHDFFVIRRDQEGVYQRSEGFQIGNPTSPAIMGDYIIVASQLSGCVSVFRRDSEGHHDLVQEIWLENAKPSVLVPHGDALYVASAKSHTVFILYRQPDGTFRHIGEFLVPTGDFGTQLHLVLHGDVLLLASGTKLTTLSYPKPGKK